MCNFKDFVPCSNLALYRPSLHSARILTLLYKKALCFHLFLLLLLDKMGDFQLVLRKFLY